MASAEQRSAAARRAAAARWGREATDEERAARAELEASRIERRSAPCVNCGEPVGHARRKYCAKRECFLARRATEAAERRARDGHERLRYGYTEATAAAYHKRRALKKGATVEDFRPSEIYDRDGWICGICSETVDRDLKWPEPMSVSLDHITPLALGGDHSRANTQCAHLTCNVRKGAAQVAA